MTEEEFRMSFKDEDFSQRDEGKGAGTVKSG